MVSQIFVNMLTSGTSVGMVGKAARLFDFSEVADHSGEPMHLQIVDGGLRAVLGDATEEDVVLGDTPEVRKEPVIWVLTSDVHLYDAARTTLKVIPVEGGVLVALVKGIARFTDTEGNVSPALSRGYTGDQEDFASCVRYSPEWYGKGEERGDLLYTAEFKLRAFLNGRRHDFTLKPVGKPLDVSQGYWQEVAAERERQKQVQQAEARRQRELDAERADAERVEKQKEELAKSKRTRNKPSFSGTPVDSTGRALGANAFLSAVNAAKTGASAVANVLNKK